MNDTKNLTRLAALAIMIFAAAAMRFIPHPPNFAPILAIALFGGAYFSNRAMAFAVPLAAMVIGDIFLGFHGAIWAVYLSFGAAVLLGRFVGSRKSILSVAGISVLASVIFFVVSNFGVWLGFGMYPLNFAGLGACYTAAIPFFKYTLASTLVYSGVLFGGFELLSRYVPAMRTKAIAA
ncbi:MAG: DUF6580 family putative transport protein [Candidatus Kapaibacterium sp.]